MPRPEGWGIGVKEPSQPLETMLIVFADPENPSLQVSQDKVFTRHPMSYPSKGRGWVYKKGVKDPPQPLGTMLIVFADPENPILS